jgi:tRNA(Ile)-lysidine synthase
LLAKPGRLGNEPRHYQMPLEIGKERALPFAGGRLYVNWVKLAGQFCGNFGVEVGPLPHADIETADLDGERLKRVGDLDDLLVRNWEPGDAYRRAGHEKPEKVKSLFQEYRIVLWNRRRWPVMVLKDEIVWSPRFGAAARFQAQEESRSVLRMIFVPEASGTCE